MTRAPRRAIVAVLALAVAAVLAGILSVGSARASVPFTVDHFDVSNPGSLTAGDFFSITVTAKDSSNATITGYAGTIHFDVSSADPYASLPSDYSFDLADNGTHTFNFLSLGKAPSNDILVSEDFGGSATGSSGSITVSPSTFDHITVSPDGSHVGAGSFQGFHAETMDAFENSLGDVTDDTSFSISGGVCFPAGPGTVICMSTSAGDHTVTGDYFGFTDDATLHVDPGGLDHIEITPPFAHTATGTLVAYSVTSYDHFHNAIADVTGDSTFSIDGDGSCTANQCGSNSLGDYTVTADYSTYQVQTGLTVEVGPPDHLVLSPSSAEISVGSTQTYTANAFDAQGHDLGPVTDDTTFSIAPDGSCGVADCGSNTSDTSGHHTVTGDYFGVTGTADLTIDPGGLDHFTVEAPGGGLVGDQQLGVPFNVDIYARDQYGNVATTFAGTVDVDSNQTIAGGQFTTDLFTNGVGTAGLTLTHGGPGSIISVINSFGVQIGASNGFTVYSADGDGTISSNTSFVRNGSTGNTITFNYTVANGGIRNGALTVDVPTGWPAPSTTGTDDGFVKSNVGSISILGQTITVSGLKRLEGETVQIVYGAKSNGGSGATAPSTGGSATWQAQEKSVAGGTLTDIASGSPSINVLSADGAGTMDVSPTSAIQSSTGNTLVFTYTADPGGLNNGAISLTVPAPWAPPTTSSPTAGYVTTTALGSLSVANRVINITGLTLTGGQQFTVTYGAAPGPGATAPSAAGLTTWTTKERSSSNRPLTSIAAQPTVDVTSGPLHHFKIEAVGGGNIGSRQRNVAFSLRITAQDASNRTVTHFNGTVDVDSNRAISGGPYESAAFTNGVLASQPIMLSEGGTGSTISVTEHGGSAPGISNSFTVYSADGDGTVSADKSFARYASSGNTFTFTYTAAAGGISGGAVSLVVPSGWPDPSFLGTEQGYIKTNVGTPSIVGHTITVTGLNRTEGQKLTITYGSKAFPGPGATSPSRAGVETWQVQEKSVSGGTLTDVTSGSPSISVLAPDGSGTMDASPTSVTASTPTTLTFTYTAAAGGMNNGSLQMVLPPGWQAQATVPASFFYTTGSPGGTLTVSGGKITVTGVTLAEGETYVITYGDTSGGSLGAIVPPIFGPYTWITKQRSSSAGVYTAIATPPVVTVT